MVSNTKCQFSLPKCDKNWPSDNTCTSQVEMMYCSILFISKEILYLLSYKPIWQGIIHLRVFSWPTRLQQSLKPCKVRNQKAAKWQKSTSSFFGWASSKLCESLIMVLKQNNSILYWTVHYPITFHNLEISQDAWNHILKSYGFICNAISSVVCMYTKHLEMKCNYCYVQTAWVYRYPR